jgi:hypothetical protein
MKTTRRILSLITIVLIIFSFLGNLNPVFGACEALCSPSPLIRLCLPIFCDTCPWCLREEEGIYNPVISPSIGRGEGADIIARLIANFLKITFSVAGLVLLAMLLWGGIQWMTAGEDKEKMAKAQGRITSTLIGFVIFMSVFAIINFIAPALGLGFLQVLKIEWPTP